VIEVVSVAPDSLGAALGLTPGFVLDRIDGRELGDFLDWEFLTAEDRFLLEARSPQGEPYEFDVERPEGLPMGVEVEPPRVRRCGNRCDFCFVDGLPEGLRETLYIRDDDYRLSFRYGNFATLTNLKERDTARIIEYRLSPLYVSVHATDPVVRRRLLRNPRAPDIIEQLRGFAEHGITFHTQVVLQPGVNDDAALAQSLDDLYALGDAVLSVSVVPVGLTEFSKHHLVHAMTPAQCRQAIDLVDTFAARALGARGSRWVYGSDDLYLGAETELPPAEAYDGFEQVENGVGAVRYLQTRITDEVASLSPVHGRRIGVVTGVAMGRLMPQVLETLEGATGAAFDLLVLENPLFGAGVTSAALLPGAAFRDALADRDDLELALLPAEALNDRALFLDGMSADELAEAVPVPIRYSYCFTDALDEAVT
jgi:putative radical SAM enzyme (TIGR03279 family)